MMLTSYEVARQTLLILAPELLLLLAATAMMTAAPFARLPRRAWCAMAASALVVALVALASVHDRAIDMYSAVALNDPLAFWSRAVLALTGLIILALAHDQVDDARAAEFFASLLMIDAGAMLVASANELVFLFIGLELVSIPTYLLLYLPRRNAATQEAATKYFYLSIFSSGLLLFGLAFLYGLTGVSNLKALAYLSEHVPSVPQVPLARVAIVFIMAGLGFRVAAVPFHFYAPDVYEGSPTVVAALLAWVPKAIGFLAMVRALTSVVAATGPGSPLGHDALVVTWIMAVVTMTLGNTVALTQENLKRLLAYSSIAHAGYLLIGVAVAFRNAPGARADFLGAQGMLFYLVAYALMTLGAFGVIVLLSRPERAVEMVDDLAGLGRTRPVAALAMAICLFSLTGIPPLAGFWGKFELFAAAFSAGQGGEARIFQSLAIIGVLNAAVGAYYYLRIVVVMYLRPAATPAPVASRPGWPTVAAVAACAGLTVLLGLIPAPVARTARLAAESAAAHPDPLPEAIAADVSR